jgi:transcriptional regulator with XRE-family HTH domain
MIKENRILRNYTQEEFAEILEITPRQLQRIEKDEEKTKIKTLKKIIKILKIPDKEIIEFMKK